MLVLAGVVGLLCLTWVALAYLAVMLVRQQGRLLLRVEALEQGLVAANAQQAPPPVPAGLPPGEPLTPFRLPDMDGKLVGLEDLRGSRALLVHWSPECGFCIRIAPELARIQGELRRRDTELVLLSYGDSETNRRLAAEHGLECRILLAPQGAPPEAFAQMGTPVAYLVDEHGRVAAPLAVGASEVPALAHAVAKIRKRLATERPLSDSRIVRDGLAPGTPAPLFELPDLDGTTVALEAYRGRRVLLVFSDPGCGPCNGLAPELARLARQVGDSGPAVVMVSRGELEENRRKADEHDLRFPVVIQPRWKVSQQYGIFATPVAFLIDEEGVISRKVAQGVDEILALARAGHTLGREVQLN